MNKMKAAKVLKMYEEIIEPEVHLDIPREAMPQIDGKDIEDFMSYLSDIGVSYEEVEVPVSQLIPSQNELDTEKADKIWNEGNAGTNPIMISADNYVLDGHHRWLALQRNSPDSEMNCIQIQAPAKQALQVMHDFEGSHKKDIEDKVVEMKLAESVLQKLEEALPTPKKPERDNFTLESDYQHSVAMYYKKMALVAKQPGSQHDPKYYSDKAAEHLKKSAELEKEGK